MGCWQDPRRWGFGSPHGSCDVDEAVGCATSSTRDPHSDGDESQGRVAWSAGEIHDGGDLDQTGEGRKGMKGCRIVGRNERRKTEPEKGKGEGWAFMGEVDRAPRVCSLRPVAAPARQIGILWKKGQLKISCRVFLYFKLFSEIIDAHRGD
jgi:hypothetical protein